MSRSYGLAVPIWSVGAVLAWLLSAPAVLLAAMAAIVIYSGKIPALISFAASCAAFFALLHLPGPSFAANLQPLLGSVAFALSAAAIVLLLLGHRNADVLDRSEREARLIVESMPGMAWATDPMGRFVYVNQHLLDDLGMDKEALGRIEGTSKFGWQKMVHPDDADNAGRQWLRCLETGEPLALEHTVRQPDGSYRWFRAVGRAVRDRNGRITGWYGTTLDIDDQKRAERALRASESRYHSIFESLPGMVVGTGPRGEHQFSNQQLLDFVGLTYEEMATEGWMRILHPDEREAVVSKWRKDIAAGTPTESVHRLRRFDGVFRYMHTRFNPQRDENGVIVRWYGLLVDVDEQRKAELAVRQSEQQLQLILDTMPALAWRTDAEGRNSYFTKRTLDYIGFSGEELSLSPLRGVHPEDVPGFKQAFVQSIKSGQSFSYVFRLLRNDGIYRWHEGRGEPVRDEAGNITHWYGVNVDIDERQKAQEALRISEQRFRLLIDTVPALVWSATPEGKRSYTSNRTLAYFGMDRDDLTIPRFNMIHPEDAEKLASAWARSLATGQSFLSTHRLRRADGEYRWHESRAEALHDESGKIVEWYGVNVDVDDRQKAEEALRRREQQLRQLTDTIPALVWCANADGELSYVNKRLMDYTGVSLEDLDRPGSTRLAGAIGVVHPDDRHAVSAALGRSFTTGESYELRHRLRRADGIYRWVDGRAEPLRDEEGRIIMWYGVDVDVDDRQTAEDALRNSEQELQMLIDAIPTFVWSVSPKGEPAYQSRRTLEYFGITPEEIPQFRQKCVHPDDLPALGEAWTKSLTTGETFSSILRLRRADGEYRWHEARADPLRDRNGHILQWYGCNVDVDERIKAEQALRTTRAKFLRASELASLSEMSASIAHEVNQPLTAIVSHGHACQRWLAASPPNVQRAQATAERIIRDANAASDVVGRIRALFRHSTLTRNPVNLNDVIAEVRHMLIDDGSIESVDVKTELDSTLPPVMADRVQMQQVFVNLFRNGIDAMASTAGVPKLLCIKSLRDGPDAIRVEVRDHGGGMDDPERVFEPFFTTKENGMGMGLAICRSIVEAHQGKLWAANNEPQGAVFSLVLPLDADASL